MRRNAGGLQQPRGPLGRKQGLWSYNGRELDSDDHRNELGSTFFPRASRTECDLANVLISAMLYQIAYPQKCELINGCCFKVLVCSAATAAEILLHPGRTLIPMSTAWLGLG